MSAFSRPSRRRCAAEVRVLFLVLLACLGLPLGPGIVLADGTSDSLIVGRTEFCSGDAIQVDVIIPSAVRIPVGLVFYLEGTLDVPGTVLDTLDTLTFMPTGTPEPVDLTLPENLIDFFGLSPNQTLANDTLVFYFEYLNDNRQLCSSNRVLITVTQTLNIDIDQALIDQTYCLGQSDPIFLRVRASIRESEFQREQLEYVWSNDQGTIQTPPTADSLVLVNPSGRGVVRYTVTISAPGNPCSTPVQSSADITFAEPPMVNVIGLNPSGFYCPGEPISVTVESGALGPDDVIWRDPNGDPMPNFRGSLMLTFQRFNAAQAGEYSVEALVGECWSEPEKFRLDIGETVAIQSVQTEQPAYCVGEDVNVNFSYSGTATQVRVVNGGQVVSSAPASSRQLSLPGNAIFAGATYNLEVEGSCNTDTTPFSINVVEPSNIVVMPDPSSFPVQLADGYSFSMQVTGAAPGATFQWTLDNVLLPNETNDTYRIVSMRPDQAGEYGVRIMEPVGSPCPDIVIGPLRVDYLNRGGIVIQLGVPDTIRARLGSVFDLPVQILNVDEVGRQIQQGIDFDFQLEVNATLAIPEAPLDNGTIEQGIRTVNWVGSASVPLDAELGRMEFTAALGNAISTRIDLFPVSVTARGQDATITPDTLSTVLLISDVPVDGDGNPILINPFSSGLEIILSPNPVTAGDQIALELHNLDPAGEVAVELFDVMGNRMADWSDVFAAGATSANVNLSDYAQLSDHGVYYIRLVQGRRSVTRLLTISGK